MISNTKLIKENKGDLLKVENERRAIVDSLKDSLNRYFNGLGVKKAIVSNFNNGDLRISIKKANLKGFSLDKLFKAFNLKYNKTYENETTVIYCIYVFN
ncbi:MAG: hypothetical protein IKG40_01340 [Bacilli bacterium]|nr:hypothetical protein [Bacilli bacterium]